MNEHLSNPHARRTNYSYIEEQNEVRTELLNNKVNQLKHLAVQIGEETRYQNKYLKVSLHFFLCFILEYFLSRNYMITWKIAIVWWHKLVVE